MVRYGKTRERYSGNTGGKTVRAHRGTRWEGQRTAEQLCVLVVTRRASSCPRPAMVHAFGREERTVACARNEQESRVKTFLRSP